MVVYPLCHACELQLFMGTAFVLCVSLGWNRDKKCPFFPQCGDPTAKEGRVELGEGGGNSGVMEMQGKRGQLAASANEMEPS